MAGAHVVSQSVRAGDHGTDTFLTVVSGSRSATARSIAGMDTAELGLGGRLVVVRRRGLVPR